MSSGISWCFSELNSRRRHLCIGCLFQSLLCFYFLSFSFALRSTATSQNLSRESFLSIWRRNSLNHWPRCIWLQHISKSSSVFKIKESCFAGEFRGRVFHYKLPELIHCETNLLIIIEIIKVLRESITFLLNWIDLALYKRFEWVHNILIGDFRNGKITSIIWFFQFRDIRWNVSRFPRQELLVFRLFFLSSFASCIAMLNHSSICCTHALKTNGQRKYGLL